MALANAEMKMGVEMVGGFDSVFGLFVVEKRKRKKGKGKRVRRIRVIECV